MHVNPKPKPPLPGGEHTFMTDTGRQAVPPGIPVVNLVPVGDGGPGPLLPRMRKRKKLLPSCDEIAKLPRWARVAFAERCALRVEPLVQLDTTTDAGGAAAIAIRRATPEPWALKFIRRDFERLRQLAKANDWTDDTQVPPEVFGPLWPEGRVPEWAKQTNEPRA